MSVAAVRLASLPAIPTATPGERLRSARLARHLTMREVVDATQRLSVRFENAEFRVSLAHLSEIEAGGAMPNLYRICSLAMIYEMDIIELMGWFVPEASADLKSTANISNNVVLFGFPNNRPRCA